MMIRKESVMIKKNPKPNQAAKPGPKDEWGDSTESRE